MRLRTVVTVMNKIQSSDYERLKAEIKTLYGEELTQDTHKLALAIKRTDNRLFEMMWARPDIYSLSEQEIRDYHWNI